MSFLKAVPNSLSPLLRSLAAVALAGLLLPVSAVGQPPPASSPPTADAAPEPPAPPPLTAAAINGAAFRPPPAPDAAHPPSKTPDPLIIKTEVLLDRQNVSPGVIDGLGGENLSHALEAFAKMKGLPQSPELTPQVFAALTQGQGPVVARYTITPADVAGPFYPDVGEDFVKMSEQKSLGYHSPEQLLSERFHMDEALLKALNPNVDFSKAGQQILVADSHPPALPPVALIRVDKATNSVEAFGSDGKMLAFFPATVGSTDRPSPKGDFKVVGVAQNPDYTYDPSKLTWGPKSAGKLHIPPGPNGPVGIVWIALSAKDYGIHGTPDARLIGKTASHGCVRLPNWDAEMLSRAVKPGVPVDFVS